MTTRTKWAIAVFLLLLAYGLLIANCLPRPYERPPEPTKAEERLMEKARKRHGNYTQIVSIEGIYLERKGRGGKMERVWIIRNRRGR